MTSLASLASMPTRCTHGYDLKTQHGRESWMCRCGATSTTPTADKDEAWSIFRAALATAVRSDGTVHACDMRPLTHGRIAPRLLSSCWSRARREHLLDEAGTERSNDEAGKNAGRWEPYYELRSAA